MNATTKTVKVIQQHYGHGWEDVSEYENPKTKEDRALISHDIKEYRLMGYPTRLITRRVVVLFNLCHKGEVKYTGSENACYIQLQRLQSQSAEWAMKYEKWSIDQTEVTRAQAAKILDNSLEKQLA